MNSVPAAGGGGKRARNRGQGLRRQTDHMGLEDDGKDCRIDSQETEKPLEVLSRGTARSSSPFNFKLGTLSGFKILSFPQKRSILHTRSTFHMTTGTHQHSRLPRTLFHHHHPQPPFTSGIPRLAPEGICRASCQFVFLQGKLLTAAVGSLCVQATGSRSFQSVSPSS